MYKIIYVLGIFCLLCAGYPCPSTGRGSCEEIVSLEELKESATDKNIKVRLAEEELEAFTAENSLLNNIRATASYNFETQTHFYGVTCSIPFGFYKTRRSAIDYKKLEIERVKQDVLREVEDLYLKYMLLEKETTVYKISFSKAELNYELAREDFKYDRITKCDFMEAEKNYTRAFYEDYKAKEELEGIKRVLYGTAGIDED